VLRRVRIQANPAVESVVPATGDRGRSGAALRHFPSDKLPRQALGGLLGPLEHRLCASGASRLRRSGGGSDPTTQRDRSDTG